MTTDLKAELLRTLADLILVEYACDGCTRDGWISANERIQGAGGTITVLEKLREKVEAA